MKARAEAAAPEHLSEAARQAWDSAVGSLPEGRVLSGPERMLVEGFAVQVARMRDAQARVDSEGLVVADEKGRPTPHPAIVLERAAHDAVRAAVKDLRAAGLAPAQW